MVPSVGFLAAALASAALALILAFLVIVVKANQVAAGLAVGVLGLGLSALFGKSYKILTISGLQGIGLPVLSQIPVIGPTVSHHLMAQTVSSSRRSMLQPAIRPSPMRWQRSFRSYSFQKPTHSIKMNWTLISRDSAVLEVL